MALGVKKNDLVITQSLAFIATANAITYCGADPIFVDVDEFNFPEGRLAIYMFNPFGEDKMGRLIEKLEARTDDTLIIYHNPKHHKCFAPSKRIAQMVWRHFGLYEEKCFFYLYEAKLKQFQSNSIFES